jgi:hypothetical protein
MYIKEETKAKLNRDAIQVQLFDTYNYKKLQKCTQYDPAVLHSLYSAMNNTYIKFLIEKYRVDMNTQDEYTGNTLLSRTVARNQQALFKYLLKRGADVNIENKKGKTALQIASEIENKELVQLLTEDSDADASSGNERCGAAVRTASEFEDSEVSQKDDAALRGNDSYQQKKIRWRKEKKAAAFHEYLQRYGIISVSEWQYVNLYRTEEDGYQIQWRTTDVTPAFCLHFISELTKARVYRDVEPKLRGKVSQKQKDYTRNLFQKMCDVNHVLPLPHTPFTFGKAKFQSYRIIGKHIRITWTEEAFIDPIALLGKEEGLASYWFHTDEPNDEQKEQAKNSILKDAIAFNRAHPDLSNFTRLDEEIKSDEEEEEVNSIDSGKEKKKSKFLPEYYGEEWEKNVLVWKKNFNAPYKKDNF